MPMPIRVIPSAEQEPIPRTGRAPVRSGEPRQIAPRGRDDPHYGACGRQSGAVDEQHAEERRAGKRDGLHRDARIRPLPGSPLRSGIESGAEAPWKAAYTGARSTAQSAKIVTSARADPPIPATGRTIGSSCWWNAIRPDRAVADSTARSRRSCRPPLRSWPLLRVPPYTPGRSR